MSRRRYLSTKISQDAKINRLATQHGDFAALLYTWMIPHAEDDGTLTGDPDELLMTVVPGRRDKSADDITSALEAMCAQGLIEWQREGERPLISFPTSFYTYQSYIGEKRRETSQTHKPRKQAESPAQNSADDDATAQNAANQRKSAQNAASFSSSLKVSSSVTTPTVGATEPTADATEPPAGDSAPTARSTEAHASDGSSSSFSLPERIPSETERAYWERVMKELPSAQRIPMLVQLARDKIGLENAPPGGEAYKRLGALAKKHHASLVAVWIIQASAQHIAGDPLDYLTKLANGQLEREARSNGRHAENGRHASAHTMGGGATPARFTPEYYARAAGGTAGAVVKRNGG